MDSLTQKRDKGSHHDDRVVSELLVQMQGFQERGNIFLIGATNFPWRIDAAIMRRF
jgi:SpoVK/Ycf46/Vps4 family AAA+-type ATPase